MGSSGGGGTSQVTSTPAPFEIPEEFKPLVESAVKEIVATQKALPLSSFSSFLPRSIAPLSPFQEAGLARVPQTLDPTAGLQGLLSIPQSVGGLASSAFQAGQPTEGARAGLEALSGRLNFRNPPFQQPLFSPQDLFNVRPQSGQLPQQLLQPPSGSTGSIRNRVGSLLPGQPPQPQGPQTGTLTTEPSPPGSNISFTTSQGNQLLEQFEKLASGEIVQPPAGEAEGKSSGGVGQLPPSPPPTQPPQSAQAPPTSTQPGSVAPGGIPITVPLPNVGTGTQPRTQGGQIPGFAPGVSIGDIRAATAAVNPEAIARQAQVPFLAAQAEQAKKASALAEARGLLTTAQNLGTAPGNLIFEVLNDPRIQALPPADRAMLARQAQQIARQSEGAGG